MLAFQPVIINLIVTASNLAALPSIVSASSYADKFVCTLIMVASTFMHISERKHRLPGIAPFNQWSRQLEMVDRAMSWIAGAYFVFYYYPVIIANYGLAIFGLLMITLAERVDKGYLFFLVTHLLWHFSVFRMTYLLVQSP